MKYDRRGSWYLLTGAVVGIALGLFYSWVISPVKYVDAPPYALRADFKDEYRALVAAAYLYSSDLLRAKDRLAQLRDDEITQSLAIQAQRALSEGHPEGEVEALGNLAMAIDEGMPPIEPSFATTQVVNTPLPVLTETPTPVLNQPGSSLEVPTLATSASTGMVPITQATNTVRPPSTAKPTPTLGAAFVLKETRLVCNPDQPQPLIQVLVQDAAGQPVPSIEITVTWDGGEDHFFTGLKPELSLGYADFLMNPEEVYSLMLNDGGNFVTNLTAAECQLDDGSRSWGSWLLTFTQP